MVNERLMDFLWRSEVARLPEERRSFYRFIVEKEDLLAEAAMNVEEFRSLIIKESPVDLAVEHFNLPYDDIVNLLMEIEEELGQKVDIRFNRVKWIDFTDHFPINTRNNKEKQLFLFIH
ncbi:hypothetical protein [Planococcus sp. CAU13]|uniref:hypothetical protein n=1 Tax=Planococcus sp. CAU13 TaxID=1541197 RepID=UPI00053009C4|nr:hypothetical protein [Planococcus sp. CAU13]